MRTDLISAYHQVGFRYMLAEISKEEHEKLSAPFLEAMTQEERETANETFHNAWRND